MPRRLTLVLVPVMYLLATSIALSAVQASAPPGWAARPGTIGHAMTLPDGSHVYIDAVLVDKIRAKVSPGYLVVHECFAPGDRLIVLTRPAPELRLGETVDVEGTITTLPNGHRAIINPTVYGYLDAQGRLLLHGPLKGFNSPIAWPWKTDLTASSALTESMATAIPAEPDPDPDEAPSYYPTISDVLEVAAAPTEGLTAKSGAVRMQSYYDEIPDVQGLPDGSLVELQCKRITGVGTQTIDGTQYKYVDIAEDLPAEDWIRTYYTNDVSPSDRVSRITGQIAHVNDIPVICVDTGAGYDPQLLVGTLTMASAGTIAWAKTWPDNHDFVADELTGKVVTRKWTDCLYIEEDDRSSGIRVSKTAHGRSPGERVNVVGVLKTDAVNFERYIDASDISQNGTGSVAPLGMINRSLGGGGFYYNPNTGQGQRGITGGAGLNNIGLLVRTWGTISELDSASPPLWFRLSDGSNVQTTVAYPPFAYALNDFVTIAGISSCEIDANGDLQRVLSPQPLICTICKAEGQADPTNTSPVNFTVTFSEPVSGFAEDGVTVSGVAGATATVSGSGATYNVAVDLPVSGTVTVSVPSGKARNASGVSNYASTDASALYDNEIPVIANCTVAPVLSSGEVTITYTGASDTGGSGLLAVGLYQVIDEQYDLVAARTGSTDTFTLNYTGNGIVDNLVLIAFDNAGNQSADKVVPSFTVDQTPPTQPANVVMAHVLPTSRNIHATWDASTDANGIQNYSYQFWYVDGTGLHGLSNVLTTTNTYATFDVGGYLPTGTTTYGIRVWARDSAGNVSDYTDSSGVQCTKVKVGFLYYKCKTGVANTYDDTRWYIDSYLNKVKNGADCSGKVTYTKLTSAPVANSDYDSYDVLFVALPVTDFTTAENSALQWFADRGFNRRLVLVGEYGKTMYGNGFSVHNNRLNGVASLLNRTTRFHADENTQNSYPYEQGISYRDCPVRSHYLTNGVGALWDAGPSTFATCVNPIAALRDGENAYPGQFWVVEEDVSQGCSFVFIHDCSLFLYEYDNLLQYSPKNPVNNAETDYDDVPDRNFKFAENLYTVFSQ